MKVYVSGNLESIKSSLIDKGYEVVNEINEGCEAIICDIKNSDISSLNINKYKGINGVLVIDYGSKNVEDIDNIINDRNFN
ncbi:YkuS family protein [Clostridium sp. MSJ-4]|uniref:YkuS family protein n=1 Tax=Clostridium simiarum TaxID=2841506 RepID=A0ABS6F3D8_9CLOT|nr:MULTISPECIES: YkuS family protein [Clostridium]MBU5592400.1 YkuS family protein [Clostridium simiarum]